MAATASTDSEASLDERIVVLDGAWGMLIQARGSPRRTTAASASASTRTTSRATPTCST